MADIYGTPAPIPLNSDAPIRGIGVVDAVKRFFIKYATFTGRASQSEFWWVALFNAVFGLILGLLAFAGMMVSVASAGVYGSYGSAAAAAGPSAFGVVLLVLIWVLALVWGLGTIVPQIALTVRRLHDADLSGLMALLLLIPYANGIISIVFGLLPAKPEGSRYDTKY